jgi:hypothetical protein
MLPGLFVPITPKSGNNITRKNKTPALFSVEGPILLYCLLLLVIPNSWC